MKVSAIQRPYSLLIVILLAMHCKMKDTGLRRDYLPQDSRNNRSCRKHSKAGILHVFPTRGENVLESWVQSTPRQRTGLLHRITTAEFPDPVLLPLAPSGARLAGATRPVALRRRFLLRAPQNVPASVPR